MQRQCGESSENFPVLDNVDDIVEACRSPNLPIMVNVEEENNAVVIHGCKCIAGVAGCDAGEAHECFRGKRGRRGVHDVRNAPVRMRAAE